MTLLKKLEVCASVFMLTHLFEGKINEDDSGRTIVRHREALLRPIPRLWWSEKPLGRYANMLGLNNAKNGTIGISQSIYGSFYSEGGVFGVIVFSILYAKLMS